MDSLQFAYWLQGFLELSGTEEMTQDQLRVVKEHLSLVLVKVSGNGKGYTGPCGSTEVFKYSGFTDA